jgi:curved DNA-binding protein CbpA
VNPYDVLDVPTDADPEQIKRAHRKAVKRSHPDAGGDREQFEKAIHAYLVLSDPVRRAKYDKTGEVDEEVPDPMAVLIHHVINAFDLACQACAEGEWEYNDRIAATRKIMKNIQADMCKQLANIETERAKLVKLERRLRFKGDGPDLLGNALRQRIDGCDTLHTQGAKDIAEYGAAIVYLDNYGFDFEAKPQPQGGAVWVTSYVR